VPAAAENVPLGDLSAKGLSDAAEHALLLLLLLSLVVLLLEFCGGSRMSLPPRLEVRGRITTRMGPLWPCAARARSCECNTQCKPDHYIDILGVNET
jgi:hypothetical protein